jgi:hypothetical protein
MKNFKEEIEAMKAQIAALENNLVCGDGQCGCGCDESPVEVEDEGPEFDGAGFSEADRVILVRGEVVTPEQAETVVFTREELITFAAKLMERVVAACKSAVSDTEFDADYCCTLDLNYNNQIEVDIDDSTIQEVVCDEIDNTIELDNDSVEVEVNNILDNMLLESEVKNKLFP